MTSTIPKTSIKGYMKFLKTKLETSQGEEKKAIKKELKKYKKLFKTLDND